MLIVCLFLVLISFFIFCRADRTKSIPHARKLLLSIPLLWLPHTMQINARNIVYTTMDPCLSFLFENSFYFSVTVAVLWLLLLFAFCNLFFPAHSDCHDLHLGPLSTYLWFSLIVHLYFLLACNSLPQGRKMAIFYISLKSIIITRWIFPFHFVILDFDFLSF